MSTPSCRWCRPALLWKTILTGYLTHPARHAGRTGPGAHLEGLWPILRYCGSVWDLLPEADYRVLRDRYLDPVENAALIEKLDESHFQVMPQMGESLRRARNEYGVNVSIMASTGNGLATGSQSNSDSSSIRSIPPGAYCARWGSAFQTTISQRQPFAATLPIITSPLHGSRCFLRFFAGKHLVYRRTISRHELLG